MISHDLTYHIFTFTFHQPSVQSNDIFKQRIYLLLLLFTDINPKQLLNAPMDYALLDDMLDYMDNRESETTRVSDKQTKNALLYKSIDYVRKAQIEQDSNTPTQHTSSVMTLDKMTTCSILTKNVEYIDALTYLMNQVFNDDENISVHASTHMRTISFTMPGSL